MLLWLSWFDDVAELALSSDFEPKFSTLKTVNLSFRVAIARSSESLERASANRIAAYERHGFKIKDWTSFKSESVGSQSFVSLVAEDKLTGMPIASARLQVSTQHELSFLKELEISEKLNGLPLLCISRFSASSSKVGQEAKMILMKAIYLYAVAKQVKQVFIFVDTPRARLYSSFGFKPVFKDDPVLTLSYNNEVPLRLLYISVVNLQSNVRNSSSRIYDCFFRLFHPDIEIFSSVSSRFDFKRVSDGPLDFSDQPSGKGTLDSVVV